MRHDPIPAREPPSDDPDLSPSLTIGRLAAAAGVGVETIRYYQQRGLLPLPPGGRDAGPGGGYRRYPRALVDRIRFIKRAQTLGFSLEEIGSLLVLQDGTDRASIRSVTAARLAQIEEKLADLARMQRLLRALLQECEHAGPAAPCPIIENLVSASTTSGTRRRSPSPRPRPS